MAKVDPLKSGFLISSYWGPRPETPGQIAARCANLLDRLNSISLMFSGWTYVGRRILPMDRRHALADTPGERYQNRYRTVVLGHPTGTDLAPLVEAGVCRDDDDGPEPMMGYRFSAFTRSRTDPGGLSLRVRAGCLSDARFFTNTVHIETRPLCDENRSWLTLPLLKAAMLAIVTTCDVTWAAIYPAELRELWIPAHVRRGPTFQLAWVTYLSPRFAPMVTPPASAIVEHTAQRGIVMAATNDRFDVNNPAHLAAAREIEAAIAPVNALPWPPDAIPG